MNFTIINDHCYDMAYDNLIYGFLKLMFCECVCLIKYSQIKWRVLFLCKIIGQKIF